MQNEITAFGITGSDLDMREYENGTLLGTTTLYVNTWSILEKDKVSSKYRIHFWNERAENAQKLIKSGTKIFVRGTYESFKSGEKGIEYYIIKVKEWGYYGATLFQIGTVTDLTVESKYNVFTFPEPKLKIYAPLNYDLTEGEIVIVNGEIIRKDFDIPKVKAICIQKLISE